MNLWGEALTSDCCRWYAFKAAALHREARSAPVKRWAFAAAGTGFFFFLPCLQDSFYRHRGGGSTQSILGLPTHPPTTEGGSVIWPTQAQKFTHSHTHTYLRPDPPPPGGGILEKKIGKAVPRHPAWVDPLKRSLLVWNFFLVDSDILFDLA